MDTTDIITSAQKAAMEQIRKYSQPKIIASFIQIMICAVCIIGIQWVAVGFDLECWTRASFWISTVCMTVGVTCLFRAVINSMYVKTENRPNVVKTREKYEEKNAKKKRNFKTFIDLFNVKSKMTAYFYRMQKTIFKLEKKRLKTNKSKKLVKIDDKIAKTKSVMSEEYVKENIDRIKAKYYMVYVNDFSSSDVGANGKLNTRGASQYNLKFNLATLKKAILYVIPAVAMSAAILADTEMTVQEILVKIFASIFMIIGTVVGALVEAERIYDSTITASLLDRIAILEEYEVWLESNPDQTELDIERTKIEQELKTKYDKEYNEKLTNEVKRIETEVTSRLRTKGH